MNLLPTPRPVLRPIPKPKIDPAEPGFITMSIGQWDVLLSECYKAGWILLELDAEEQFVQAYQIANPRLTSTQRRVE